MTNFVWRPTPCQRELFEEWKSYALGLLVSSKDGMQVYRFGIDLGDHVQETVPLEKMGFPTINHFLHEMGNCSEIRKWFNPVLMREELLVFIKEFHVPKHMKHIRNMVNRQAKRKKPKRDIAGRPIKMTKENSKLVHMSELLKQAPSGHQTPPPPPAKSIPRKRCGRQYASFTSRAPFDQDKPLKPQDPVNGHYGVKEDPLISLRDHRPAEKILWDPRSAGYVGISTAVPSSFQSGLGTQSLLETLGKLPQYPNLYAAKPRTSRPMQEDGLETVSKHPPPYEGDTSSETSAQVAIPIPRNPDFHTVTLTPDGLLKTTAAGDKTDSPSTSTTASEIPLPGAEVKVTSSTKPAKPPVIPQKRNTADAVEAFVRSLRPAGQANLHPTSEDSIQIQNQSVGKPSPLPKNLTAQPQFTPVKVSLFNPSLIGTVCPRHSVESIFSIDYTNEHVMMKVFKDLKIPAAARTSLEVLPRKTDPLTLSLKTFMDYYMGTSSNCLK